MTIGQAAGYGVGGLDLWIVCICIHKSNRNSSGCGTYTHYRPL